MRSAARAKVSVKDAVDYLWQHCRECRKKWRKPHIRDLAYAEVASQIRTAEPTGQMADEPDLVPRLAVSPAICLAELMRGSWVAAGSPQHKE